MKKFLKFFQFVGITVGIIVAIPFAITLAITFFAFII